MFGRVYDRPTLYVTQALYDALEAAGMRHEDFPAHPPNTRNLLYTKAVSWRHLLAVVVDPRESLEQYVLRRQFKTSKKKTRPAAATGLAMSALPTPAPLSYVAKSRAIVADYRAHLLSQRRRPMINVDLDVDSESSSFSADLDSDTDTMRPTAAGLDSDSD